MQEATSKNIKDSALKLIFFFSRKCEIHSLSEVHFLVM